MPEIYSVARNFSGNIDNFHIISLSDARNFSGNIDTFQIIYLLMPENLLQKVLGE